METVLENANIIENTSELSPLLELIQTIMELDDEQLNDSAVESISGMISGSLSPTIRRESIQSLGKSFEDQNYSRAQASYAIETIKQEFNELVDTLKPSAKKKTLIDSMLVPMYEIFDIALEQYHNYNIELPIKLDEGAKMPTYAHDIDVAADLYAADNITISANSRSTMVRTGVHIQLPEGWMAIIFPRSSIGSKTGLRLSNSAGIIDTGYTGQLGVLYDNISDSDYTINAGDRIAQLMIMPVYRFKAKQVESLEDTDRGENGFGSTGK